MRTTQYKALMETLDNAVDNGHGDDVLNNEPSAVLADIIDSTGDRQWEDVPAGEMHAAIRSWQERNA